MIPKLQSFNRNKVPVFQGNRHRHRQQSTAPRPGPRTCVRLVCQLSRKLTYSSDQNWRTFATASIIS